MSDVNFTRYNKSKEVVDGLIDALRQKAAFHGVKGAAVVMGFEKVQLPYEGAGVCDVIAIDEEEGTTLELADAVIRYCNSCLKDMAENGTEHFETIDFDGRGTSAGCAVLNIEDMLFVMAVMVEGSIHQADTVLHVGNIFCPFRAWYGRYDCVACGYE